MQFTVTLIVDDEVVGEASDDVAVSFATATVLMGQGAGRASVPVSEAIYDEVQVIKGGTNLLANSGFEDPVLASAFGQAQATFGNWRSYAQNNPLPNRVTSPRHAGSYAGQVLIPSAGSNNNRYFHQDIALDPGDFFDLDFWIYPAQLPTNSTVFSGRIDFDWDRPSDTISGTAAATMNTTATFFGAWGVGGSVDPLTEDEWHHVILRIATTPDEVWRVGGLSL